MRLLSICRQFVSAASSSSADPYHGLSTLEERLFFEFQQLLLSLFRCLSSSESAGAKSGVGLEFGAKWSGHPSGSEADLNQLLLRLNFNHFLSGANGSLQTSRPLEIEHQQVDLG
ncbi:unnamed protein product [Dicrocoelium dendriticum]|nr:unnamed protein product [Dicrocoelium dendriticum]